MLDYTILEYGDTFCPAAWVSEGNTVNYHKIYYCLSGSAVYQDSSGVHSLSPGRIYIFPQSCSYQVTHSREGLFHVLWFHADTRLPLVSEFYGQSIVPGDLAQSLLSSLALAVSKRPEILGALLPVLHENSEPARRRHSPSPQDAPFVRGLHSRTYSRTHHQRGSGAGVGISETVFDRDL